MVYHFDIYFHLFSDFIILNGIMSVLLPLSLTDITRFTLYLFKNLSIVRPKSLQA